MTLLKPWWGSDVSFAFIYSPETISSVALKVPVAAGLLCGSPGLEISYLKPSEDFLGVLYAITDTPSLYS